mmetsp:Transcript_13237/g.49096  ORF Transcript_13237/g.49096 Transcript_13237/m.49096 type:complete len:203 (-) Transcript_13237:2294-2902(-)
MHTLRCRRMAPNQRPRSLAQTRTTKSTSGVSFGTRFSGRSSRTFLNRLPTSYLARRLCRTSFLRRWTFKKRFSSISCSLRSLCRRRGPRRFRPRTLRRFARPRNSSLKHRTWALSRRTSSTRQSMTSVKACTKSTKARSLNKRRPTRSTLASLICIWRLPLIERLRLFGTKWRFKGSSFERASTRGDLLSGVYARARRRQSM